MTKINLDIIEAIDADGVKAAIRIHGLSSMPLDPTFRIDPIDEALAQEGEVDWPAGPRRPAAVYHKDGVYNLILGPDVLESPLLLPGTPVIISITDTPVAAELVWPSIATHSSRTRRPVIVTEALRNAEKTTTEAKRREAAAALAAATARAETEARTASPKSRKPRTGANGVSAPRLATTNGADVSHASTVIPEVVGDAPVFSGLRLQPNPSPHSASTLIRQDRAGAVLNATGTALTPLPSADAPPPSRRGRQILAFGGGMTAAALLVFGLVQMRVLNLQPAGQVAGGAPDVALTAARNAGSLRAVLATGGISPRGKAASGVDGSAALRLSDVYLHGSSEAPRDQGEASFWLRHALSQPIDQESMKWALTQLGSIYASPEGFEPDYAKARLLWEISGALGDPVALCFNASLYEYGLGVPKHKDLARALYERARNAGGCRGVDEALGRTK